MPAILWGVLEGQKSLQSFVGSTSGILVFRAGNSDAFHNPVHRSHPKECHKV